MSLMHRDRWNPGDLAWFHYSSDPTGPTQFEDVRAHTGQVVIVLAENECDGQRVTMPTIEERADAGMLLTYRVRFADSFECDVFEDELNDVT